MRISGLDYKLRARHGDEITQFVSPLQFTNRLITVRDVSAGLKEMSIPKQNGIKVLPIEYLNIL